MSSTDTFNKISKACECQNVCAVYMSIEMINYICMYCCAEWYKKPNQLKKITS